MIFLTLFLFICSFWVDGQLLLVLSEQDPDRFKKMGSPDMSDLTLNPQAMFAFLLLLLLPIKYPSDSLLYRSIWQARGVNLLWILSAIFTVMNF